MGRIYVWAQLMQALFIVNSILFIGSIVLDYPIFISSIFLLTQCLFAIIVFFLKCKKCGVNYFFDPAIKQWNITGINLLKPLQSHCMNCAHPH